MKTLPRKPTVLKDKKSFSAQLKEANDFFNDKNLPPAGKYLSMTNPYADKDGLVEFVVGTELTQDPVVMENLTTQKKYLVALTSIVTDYVNRYAEAYGQEFKTDIELWTLALSKIPLMGPSKVDQQTYSRNIRGVEIATDFVNFILEIVASEGTSALASFNKFLEKQGDAIRFGIDQNSDFYRTITIGVSVEVFKVGDEVIYTPKIKQYKVKFDRKNSTFTSACIKVEFVDINFSYDYAANVFDYEALQDPAIKADFESFIQKQRKAQIEDATTFFNQDFPAKQNVTDFAAVELAS